MGKVFSTTAPIVGDTINVLYAKLLQQYGGSPGFGDTDEQLLAGIARAVGAIPLPGDLKNELLRKILIAIGGQCRCARHDNVMLLREIVRELGGKAGGASGEAELLQKWLLLTSEPPTPPAAPVATAATDIGYFGFTANWNPVVGATGYFIDVASTIDFSLGTVIIDNLSVGNVTSFDVAELGLDPEQEYFYRVRAVNGVGTSADSNIITVETLAFDNVLVLDNGVNDPTVIENPVGLYTYNGDPWVAIRAINAPNLEALELVELNALGEVQITNCPGITVFVMDSISGPLDTLDLTGAPILSYLNLLFVDNLVTLTLPDMGAGAELLQVQGCPALLSIVNDLTAVNSGIYIASNTALEGVSFPGLAIAHGGFQVSNCSSLTILEIPSLATVSGVLFLGALPLLTAVDVEDITATQGIVVQGTGIEELNFTALTSQTGTIDIKDNSALGILQFAALTEVEGSIEIWFNNLLSTLEFPLLENITVDLSVRDTVTDTMDFPSLETVGGVFFLAYFHNAITCNLDSLQSIGGLFIVGSNDLLTEINLASFAISFPSDISLDLSPALTTVFFNGQNFSNGTFINCIDSAFNEASVDLVLATGVASGMDSGTIDLSGGTMATPSAAGLADATTLSGNGVSVSHN